MGKIVKYCSACEESFAEKFAFCPNCAQPMTAFEMNPISGGNGGETKLGSQAGQTIIEGKKAVEDESILEIPADEPISEPIAEPFVEPIAPIAAAPTIVQAAPKAETPKIGDTKVFAASNRTQTYNLADLEELGNFDGAKTEETAEADAVPETKTFAATAGTNGDGNNRTDNFQTNFDTSKKKEEDDGYHITVIEEKNSKQRNGLLLGTMVLMVVIGLGSAIISIFNKDYGIGAIDSDNPVFFAVIDDIPMEVEEEQPKKDDDDGGGGGGGGRNEKTETSPGRLATQTEKPIIAPTKTIVQKDFELKSPIASTQGNKKITPTEGPYGDPNSKNTLSSDGMGSGGGQGSGFGTGQGSGRGTGMGSGLGSGSGSGKGDGDGPGTGTGGTGVPPPPKPPEPKPPAGPPTPINIISKPQPRYTDAARTNNVTGTVTLKVTFMANGQIGSVSPVSGLPYGLTEQAIAAAKSIRFDPPKRGGVPYSVSKTITYNFTIY